MNNPMQMINKLIGTNVNPIFRDLIQKALNGDSKGVETFARNMCKEKGIDFDSEFAKFMNNFK